KVMVNAGWMAVYGRDVETEDTPTLVLSNLNERRRVFRLHVPPINGHPARIHHHLAFAFERLVFDARDAGGDLEFRRGIEHGKKALRDQVVELLLGFRK